jgi:hypothetical protein
MKRLDLVSVVLTMAFLTQAGSALANDRGGSVLEKARPSSGCPNSMITLSGKKFGKPGTGAAWFTARVIPFAWLEEAKITSETSATTRVPFFLALTGADEKGHVSLERPPLGKRSNQVPFTLTSLVTCFKGPERKEAQEAPESKEGTEGREGPEGPEGVEGKEGKEGKAGPAGAATASTVMGGSRGAVVVPEGLHKFLAGSGLTTANATESEVSVSASAVATTASNLAVTVLGNPTPPEQSIEFALWVNGAATPLACAISTSGAHTCTDTTDTASLPAGATVSLSVFYNHQGAPTPSANLPRVTFGYQLG